MYNEYNFYNDDDCSPYSEAPQEHGSYIDSDIITETKQTQTSGTGSSGSGKHPKKKNHMSFAKKLGVCAAFAAVFGMVSGGVYVGTTRLAATGTQSSAAGTIETAANANSTVTAQTTEAKNSTTASSSSIGNTTDSESSSGDLTVEQVAADSMPALVSITNKSIQEVQNYFGGMGGFGTSGNNGSQSYEETSMGTGVIIGQTDSLIYIVTNEHVIDSAQTLTVAFVDDSTAEGTIINSDASNDIAVVSVKKSDLSSDTLGKIKVMEMGSSGDLAVGQQVVAIGNALGYGQSVSEGIVSALNRSMSGGEGIYAKGLIQTDAAINPGNSGGALLNMKGQLVGINSAKYADTEVEGMGYALPIDTIKPIVEAMINGTYTSSDSSTQNSASQNSGSQNGNAQGGNSQNGGTQGNGSQNNGSSSTDGSVQVSSDAYLGVSCTGISEEYSQYYKIPQGVYISSVTSGSAAEKAGLQKGDIITAIDGTSISSVDELTAIMNQHSSGDTVTMTVSRQSNGSYASSSVSVTFGSKSTSQQKTSFNNQ